MIYASLLTRKLFSQCFSTRRDRPKAASPKRQLLNLLAQPTFRWLWTRDIINDYLRGADVVEADERIIRRPEFDRVGFELLIAAIQLEPAVAVSVKTVRDARRHNRKRRARLNAILKMLLIAVLLTRILQTDFVCLSVGRRVRIDSAYCTRLRLKT